MPPPPDVVTQDTNNAHLAQRYPTHLPAILKAQHPGHAILSWFNSIESSAFRDGLRLIILGGALEAARRGAALLFGQIYEKLTITARFEQHDPSYDWLLTWLSEPDHQRGARNFEVDTRGSIRREWSPEEGVKLLPTFDHPRYMRFEGRLLRVLRNQNTQMFGNPSENVTITVFSQDQHIIHRLISQAQKIHSARDNERIIIYSPNRNLGSWTRSSSRHPRSLGSVILPSGVKERVREDVEEFLKSERWYSDRGVPFRRGYLLYGTPGSGKTSLITAIAGSLGLNLYVLSLAQKGLDDANLNTLVSICPPGSVVLMEDIDCAFTSREDREDSGSVTGSMVKPSMSQSGVTLSGLLNCLDGVAAQEGSLFFATTNHAEVLDPALSRPGRFDLWVEFHQATRIQARDLFLHFYPGPAGEEGGDENTGLDMDLNGVISATPAPSQNPEQEEEKSSIGSGPKPDELQLSCPDSTNPKDRQKYLLKLRYDLATQFSKSIPEGEFSVAQIQGFLMGYKGMPGLAVRKVEGWVGEEVARRGKGSGKGGSGAGKRV